MKKYLLKFKNKYLLAFTIFFVYNLFLDEVDIFTIISQNRKLSKLRDDKVKLDDQLNDTKATLYELRFDSELERFAREKKYFKKDDEDVFVITTE
jgi:cell division protein FtsB